MADTTAKRRATRWSVVCLSRSVKECSGIGLLELTRVVGGHEHKAALGDLVDAARGKVLQTETTNGQHVASEQRAEVARLDRA